VFTARYKITEAEGVYCAVRTGSLNQKDTVSSLKGYIYRTTVLPVVLYGCELSSPGKNAE
jgi:hypothetical protein